MSSLPKQVVGAQKLEGPPVTKPGAEVVWIPVSYSGRTSLFGEFVWRTVIGHGNYDQNIEMYPAGTICLLFLFIFLTL